MLLAGSVVGWLPRMPGTASWLMAPVLWLVVGGLLVERCGWKVLRTAVVWWAWVQVACLPLFWMGWTPYEGAWTGTLGKRGVLAAWLALASCWSNGWRAWALASLAVATGSLTGIPAILRLLRGPLPPMLWPWALLGPVLAWRWLGLRLTTRLDVWAESLHWIIPHWLTGWGLQQLPVGFQDAVLLHRQPTQYGASLYLNNTFLDVLLRGGLVGTLALLAVLTWAAWRSYQTRTLWTFGLALWVMTWQSVGAQPALLCLAIVWLLSLTQPRSVDAH